jgi:hypothetical protein
MKIKLILLLFMGYFIGGSSLLNAQTGIIVHLNDGSEQSFNVSADGKLYFSGNNLLIKDSVGNTSSIALSQIRKIVFEGNTSGIEAYSESGQMFIYPNPSSSYLRIGNISEQVVNVSIFSMNGKLLLRSEYRNGDQIDVSNLSHGLYIIRVDEQAFKFCKQ